jgi:hypothetical protein
VDHVLTHVRDTAQEVLVRAKQEVDPIHLVRAHPWAMVVGALAAGFVLGRLDSRGFFSQPGGEKAAEKPSGEQPSRFDLRHHVTRRLRGYIEQAEKAAVERSRVFVANFVKRVSPGAGDAPR